MASYNQEIDNIGGGLGGFGLGGGGIGFLIIILLFFACFSGGGLFGRHDGHGGHDRDELRGRFSDCCGTSNCQIDKDVLTSRDAMILDNHEIYEKGLERKIIERDMIIQEQKNQLFVGGMFAELKEGLNAKFGMIEKELCMKPNVVPTYAATVDACSQKQVNCFDRFRDGRRDHDDGCGWC